MNDTYIISIEILYNIYLSISRTHICKHTEHHPLNNRERLLRNLKGSHQVQKNTGEM